jgi:hypothetical protein
MTVNFLERYPGPITSAVEATSTLLKKLQASRAASSATNTTATATTTAVALPTIAQGTQAQQVVVSNPQVTPGTQVAATSNKKTEQVANTALKKPGVAPASQQATTQTTVAAQEDGFFTRLWNRFAYKPEATNTQPVTNNAQPAAQAPVSRTTQVVASKEPVATVALKKPVMSKVAPHTHAVINKVKNTAATKLKKPEAKAKSSIQLVNKKHDHHHKKMTFNYKIGVKH